MENDEINVYWSPQVTSEVPSLGEWNMLFPEPVTLFSDLMSQKLPDAGKETYLVCPATSARFKRTLVFKNVLESSYNFDFTSKEKEQKYFTRSSKTGLGFEILRPPTIAAGPLVGFNLHYAFFADKPLEALTTPPMFHKPQYTKMGTSIPGQFDIGQWFRPLTFEVQMWDMKGEFHLKEDEPLFYVEFKTSKKINFHRFRMNAILKSYLDACVDARKYYGENLPLWKRYKHFNQSRMPDLVLKQIKENLI